MRSLSFVLAAATLCVPAAPPPATPTPPVTTPLVSDLTIAVATLATEADLVELRGDAKPEDLLAPASRTWSNVLLLQDVPGERFLATMYGMKRGLDRNCAYCHERDDYAKDTEHKKTARRMLLATERMNRETFGGNASVTCWTCHRGTTEPEKAPADFDSRIELAVPPGFEVAAEDAMKPAREVFTNLRLLGSLPAGKIPNVMGAFSAALGVDCSFCHVKDDAAADDKPEKKFAREMMLLSSRTSADLSGTAGAVTCWTCHRGSAHPETEMRTRP